MLVLQAIKESTTSLLKINSIGLQEQIMQEQNSNFQTEREPTSYGIRFTENLRLKILN